VSFVLRPSPFMNGGCCDFISVFRIMKSSIWRHLMAAIVTIPVVCCLSVPTQIQPRQHIEKILSSDEPIELNDAVLGAHISDLLSEATEETKVFNPANVAGTWQVVHAPHLAFLSNFVLSKFRPIEYYLEADGKIASSVRYNSFVAGYGWLSTAGYYDVDPQNGNVRIVWDRCWWSTGYLDRPTPPEDGFLAPLIQSLGMIGFLEGLSFFPIGYVDETLATFYFFGLRITATKVEEPQPSIYVGADESQ